MAQANAAVAEELALGDDFDLDALLIDDEEPAPPAPVAQASDDDPELNLEGVDVETGEILDAPTGIVELPFDEPVEEVGEVEAWNDDDAVEAVEAVTSAASAVAAPPPSDPDEQVAADRRKAIAEHAALVESKRARGQESVSPNGVAADPAASSTGEPKQRRKRRTRAEIEADEARAEAQKAARSRPVAEDGPIPDAAEIASMDRHAAEDSQYAEAEDDGYVAGVGSGSDLGLDYREIMAPAKTYEPNLPKIVGSIYETIKGLSDRLDVLEERMRPVEIVSGEIGELRTHPGFAIEERDRQTPYVRPSVRLEVAGDLTGVLDELRGFIESLRG